MKKFFIPLIAVGFAACKNDTNNHTAGTGGVYDATGKTVQVITTADSTSLRLATTDTLSFAPLNQPVESQVVVFVDPDKTFQTFHGIGAALTDASAETFFKLPAAEQQAFLKAHFDKKEGLAYTVARTNINSCDFSSGSYTYVKDNDAALNSFDIAPDKKYKIPFIKQAMAAAGGKLDLFASPWSPPAWMKTNNDMLHGGKLKPDMQAAWAAYYPKFIKAYEAEGIPVWGISIQNEPMATQIWESCIYTAEEERDFLKNHLGPIMHKEGLKDKKIIVWDHNRGALASTGTKTGVAAPPCTITCAGYTKLFPTSLYFLPKAAPKALIVPATMPGCWARNTAAL